VSLTRLEEGSAGTVRDGTALKRAARHLPYDSNSDFYGTLLAMSQMTDLVIRHESASEHRPQYTITIKAFLNL